MSAAVMGAKGKRRTSNAERRTPKGKTAPPAWAGVKFKCSNPKCPGEWQLVAADECEELEGAAAVLAPPCTCGHRSIVVLDQDGGMVHRDFDQLS